MGNVEAVVNKNLKTCPFCYRQGHTITIKTEPDYPDVGLGAGYMDKKVVYGCKVCKVYFSTEEQWNKRGR